MSVVYLLLIASINNGCVFALKLTSGPMKCGK
jgi:hypothetical protein